MLYNMIKVKELRQKLEEKFKWVPFPEWTRNEQNWFLVDTMDEICDWAFGFSELETWDLICYWYIENLFDNRNYYIELTYDFEFEQDDVDELINKICDYYQEYLDMFRHFTWHN